MIFCGCLRFERFQPAERTVSLVLGLLADAAGVEQDHVGLVEVGGQLVALPAQAGHDHLAVEHVHLAADGFDKQPASHDILDFGLRISD